MSESEQRIPPSEPDRELYRCSCGESDWRACYDQPANQGVDLYLDDDGNPEVGEYHGDEDIDGDPGPNVMYLCQACGHMINLDSDGLPIEEDADAKEEAPPRG